MRICISGGGLAGLTAAYWLKKAGHEPVVIEHAAGLRRDGYGLDFFGTGYDVAERMGIIADLASRQIFTDENGGIAFVDGDGKIRAELKVDAVRRILGGKYQAHMHYSLEEVLYDAVKDDVEIRFGVSIAFLVQSEDEVTVNYDDGGSESFDLLVGADGIHSSVRTLVFGPESDFADYLGYYLASYFVSDKKQINANWENYTEAGRQVGVYKTDRADRLATLFLWQAEDRGHIDRENRGPMLREAFAGMGWQTAGLLADMPEDGGEILVDTVTQIHMDSWRRGRVVLIGDAAGCMTLISGQGASMAMGSAYVLAEELAAVDGGTGDWRQALASYEHRVRPQVELRQHKARDFAKQFVPGSELGVKLQSVVMKLVTYHAFTGLLKSQFAGDSFLETEALHRLPGSRAGVLGYRIAGKLRETDYRTLELSLDEQLSYTECVYLLIQIDDMEGITTGALWKDWRFSHKYHDKIARFAVVGDRSLSKWLARLSEPLYAREARHFDAGDMDRAREWLEHQTVRSLTA